jgi:hypothetical protein
VARKRSLSQTQDKGSQAYYDARQKLAEALERQGKDVDPLF